MKKFYSVFLVLIIACSLFFGGCSISLKGGPTLSDAVTSNGSLAVRKGNYLYFVNGYKSNTELSGGDNNYGAVKQSAIYRAKVNADGSLIYDKDGNATEIELLMPRVVGFENASIYIFGNKIYYLTPTTLKDSTGKIRFDLVDFCCANLDGTGASKLYGAQNWTTGTSKFNFVMVDNFVYLTIFDGTDLFSLKINNGKVVSNVKIATGVTSVAFDTFTSYNPSNDELPENSTAVYFTRNLTEDDSATNGNYLGKFNLGENSATKISMDNSSTYLVKNVNDGILYYSKQNTNQANAYWYYKNLSTNSFVNAQEIQLTATSYTDVVVLDFESGNNRGVIVNNGSKLRWLKNITDLSGDVELSSTILTSISLNGNDVYGFNSNGVLCKINLQTKVLTELTKSDETLLFDSKIPNLIDFDNYYAYYYKQYKGDNDKTAFYLTRMDLSLSSPVSELVGVLLEEHKVSEK